MLAAGNAELSRGIACGSPCRRKAGCRNRPSGGGADGCPASCCRRVPCGKPPCRTRHPIRVVSQPSEVRRMTTVVRARESSPAWRHSLRDLPPTRKSYSSYHARLGTAGGIVYRASREAHGRNEGGCRSIPRKTCPSSRGDPHHQGEPQAADGPLQPGDRPPVQPTPPP
jgi:hypothetical protein